jgi:hypothetical protein
MSVAAPSSAPQTVLDMDCYTGAVDVTPSGASKCAYGGVNPIEIASMDGKSVMFKVKNTFGSFTECESSDFTVRFQQEGMSGPTCIPSHVAKFSEFTNVMHRAICIDGFAEVELFASCNSGGQSKINPSGKTFGTACGGISECSHLFVLPCNPGDICGSPVATPAVSSTPAPQLSSVSTPSPITTKSVCVATLVDLQASSGTSLAWPGGALALAPDCSNGKVYFNVTQKWKTDGSVSWWNIMRDWDFDGRWDDCRKTDGVPPNSVGMYNVTCPVGGGDIKVQITLHDGSPPFKGSSNENNSNGACEGWKQPGGILVYTLIFSCDGGAPGTRRLDASAVIAGAGSEADEPSTEDDDLPYCLSEDFPCEGDEANMVYVCHYSARKGYQTFCVPETDSDVLRFYANDYCGPCEGGRGATWGKPTVDG